MEPVNRNAPCPCGSGKRYKQCCGQISLEPARAGQADTPVFDRAGKLNAAVAHLQSGRLAEAETALRDVLRLNPEDFDALHLLGVVTGDLGRLEESLALVLRAARQDDGSYRAVYDNLGKALRTALNTLGRYEDVLGMHGELDDAPQQYTLGELPPLSTHPPRVSIIVPTYNHERFVGEALGSVFAQSYPNIELVVIDDGSRDQTVACVEAMLSASPYPVRFIARENRGAHATLNEGISLATGSHIGILNSDDRYSPERVEGLVRLIEATGKGWAFTGVGFMDDAGSMLGYGCHATADGLMRSLDRLYDDRSVLMGFGSFNFAISTGNLFLTRERWATLGEFADYRYIHNWDLCLRALCLESPAILREPTYHYRFHGRNTIKESFERAQNETRHMLTAWKAHIGSITDAKRARLANCAWEQAMIKHDQAYGIGRARLLEIAEIVLKRIKLRSPK